MEREVVRIPRERVSLVIDTLTQAFHDYPVMRFEVVGHALVAPQLETWAMFHRN